MNTKQRIIFIYIYNIFYGDDNINNLYINYKKFNMEL